MKNDTVTCSFELDKDIYYTFESIINSHGESVKENILNYMQSVIEYDIPNADTILAIKEAEALKKDPNRKTYSSFSEILEELDKEDDE